MRAPRSLLAFPLLLAPAAAPAAELGLNVHQSTTVGPQVTHDAGLGWVRVDFNWLDVQPTPAAPDFGAFDAIVDAADAQGLQVLAVLAYGPAWASSGDAMGDGPGNDVPLDGTYAAFVTAAVQHFAGRITHWELWNEPNLDVFFEGTPADYVSRVLVPGAAAVHAACPDCLVVGPGLATVGGEYDVWMDAALAAAKDEIDVVSGHVYADFGDGTTSDSFWNKLESHRVLSLDDGTVVYEGPLSFKEVMDAHGVTAPFWLTETGYEATLGDAAEEQAQLVYYRHVLEGMLDRPWWTGTIFYEGFDEPPAPYEWGVCVHDDAQPGGYAPKAVLGLLQQVTAKEPLFGGSGKACENGLDDDGDGLVDFPDDPDCILPSDPDEQGSVTGGAGGAGGAAGGAGGGPAAGSGGGASTGGGCAVSRGRNAESPVSLPGAGLAVAALAALRRRASWRRARAGA